MRPRLAAIGCAFAGAVGLLALPAAAQASSLPKPAMSVTTAGSYAYGARVKVTVTLKAKQPGAAVALYATPAGGKRTLVAAGKVDAAGKLYPAYTVTRATTFTAVFGGDAADAPSTASRTVTVAARVTDALTGYTSTTKTGGVTYRVYHGTGTLTLKSTVTPDKHGECLEPESEQYDAGTGWDADSKYGCDTLDSASHDTAPFSLKQAVGDRYRIRADYVRRGGDTANLSADAPWLYFEVIK
ncbi:MAG TPA: hypothetical protein VGM12_03085 [Trebonia sp.]|jgi:hypothetical protein